MMSLTCIFITVVCDLFRDMDMNEEHMYKSRKGYDKILMI